MFARFDENPAMTLRVIKETKRYGRTDGWTDGRTDGQTHGQRENSIPPTNKVCGGYKYPLQTKFAGGIKTHLNMCMIMMIYSCVYEELNQCIISYYYHKCQSYSSAQRAIMRLFFN